MKMKKVLLSPFDDLLAALGAALPDPPWAGLVAALGGFAAAWWVYVPVHELLHAFGCIVTGGSVTRLEIDARYGAALLQRLFPFVAVGSEYAGQLTGFDTRGNDLIYLATDFTPFLLTILIGVPLLLAAARTTRRGVRSSFLLGVALPVALAPFTNLAGDYYEMGSILLSRAALPLVPGLDLGRWRSDDLLKTANELLFQGAFRVTDLVGLTCGALLGAVLAWTTYGLGRTFAGWLGRTRPAAAQREGRDG